jgi:Ecdysteroid kinase-like family
MHSNFKKYLLELTESSDFVKTEVIQSLWSGYGQIDRYEFSGNSSVVVKYISLVQASNHPRGWNTDKSHNRKVKSYEVETFWYEQWSMKVNADCKIPEFLGSYKEGAEQWIILEDLDEHFPIRKSQTSFAEVKVGLKWLANFHATFMGQDPEGLWEVGTYWHLDTRSDEWEKIENQELKSKASWLDDQLNACRFKTIVHGDAKLANFCFSEDGKSIAAVDFQYVGGGCGMKDVAYFLGSCLSSNECELYEEELLNFYFLELEKAINGDFDFEAVEEEWRRIYPIAWTDFTRFLLGWMPTHQKLNGYSLRLMEEVLG